MKYVLYGLCIKNLETVPRSASDCVIAEPIVYALKNKKRVKSSRKNVVRQHLLVIRDDDNMIICVKKEKTRRRRRSSRRYSQFV